MIIFNKWYSYVNKYNLSGAMNNNSYNNRQKTMQIQLKVAAQLMSSCAIWRPNVCTWFKCNILFVIRPLRKGCLLTGSNSSYWSTLIRCLFAWDKLGKNWEESRSHTNDRSRVNTSQYNSVETRATISFIRNIER